MFDSLETGIGLDMVLWLQDLRFGLLDFIIKILDFAGEELVYIAVFGLIYWIYNKKMGLRMFVALLVISIATFFAKDVFGRLRPYQISDAVVPLFDERGFGIPSGHTSITLVVWGYLAWCLRRPAVTIAVVIYVILQAISRMIAGVHYPQSVIGGILLGIVVLAVYILLSERFAVRWSGWSIMIKALLTLAASILLSLLVMLSLDDSVRWEDYLTMAGLLLGTGLAVIFESQVVHFAPHSDKSRQIIQYVLGIIIAVAVLFGLKFAFAAITETGTLAGILRVIRYGTLAFVALGLWPYISVQVGLMQSGETKPESKLVEA